MASAYLRARRVERPGQAHEKDPGAIAEGKLADLVIVRADPRLSITHMAQIEAVVLRAGSFSIHDTLPWLISVSSSGEYVTQVTAMGPLGFEYVSAKDDPRNTC